LYIVLYRRKRYVETSFLSDSIRFDVGASVLE